MQGIDRGGFLRQGIAIKTGVTFISFFVFLFLMLPVSAYAELVCTDCHGPQGPHGAACNSSCDACHGNPPRTILPGGPIGLVGPLAGQTNPLPTGSLSPGAHEKHSSSSGLGYSCQICHFGGMPQSPVVGNNLIQIGFNAGGTGGGSYDGHLLNPPYSYEATNGTSVTLGGTKTCSGIYCHSDGTSVATGVLHAMSPAWDSPPVGCTACHGFPPSYGQDQPKSNSHMYPPHQQPCNVCHYATTTDGVAITDVSKHANGFYNVVPDPAALYESIPVHFDYSFDPGGGNCDNVSCHGGANWVWGRITFDAWIHYLNGPNCYEVNFDRVDFSPGATPPFTYEWDFGDGQTGTGFPIAHSYATGGPYYPVVTGRDANRHHFTGISSGVYPQPANMPPIVNSTITVESYTVTLTDLSTDPDYNTCGHSGNGELSVNWKGRGVVDTKPVAFSDTPSNTVITRSFPGFAGTIDVLQTVKDNAGTFVSKTTKITVPSKSTITVNTSPALSGVNLYLKLNGITKALGTTGIGGTYTFPNLNPGTYTVTASKSGYTFDGDPGAGGGQNPVTVIVGPNKTVTFTHTP